MTDKLLELEKILLEAHRFLTSCDGVGATYALNRAIRLVAEARKPKCEAEERSME